MSIRKGEPAKKAQKYKNKRAYKVLFNEKFSEVAKNVPLDRLCERCHDQIEWKIQYGKYKSATSLSKCIKCEEKNVNKSYRNICDKCSDKDKLCSKCMQPKRLIELKTVAKVDKAGVDKEKLKAMEDYLGNLRERSRRMLMKKLLAEEINFENGLFIYTETKQPVENLKFKVDYDDKEELWQDDEENKENKEKDKDDEDGDSDNDDDDFDDDSDN